MENTFIQTFIQKLTELDFYFMGGPDGYFLLKQEHSHLYVVNLIEADPNQDLEQHQQQKQAYLQQIKEHIYSKIRANRLIVLQLYMTETGGDQIYEQLSDDGFYPDGEIHLISWLIDLEKNILRIPPHQPSKILQVETVIQSILQRESGERVLPFQPLEQKSNNILFTLGLIALNGIIWMLMELAGGSTERSVLIKFGANEMDRILYYGQYWRLFTSMFLHIGVMHLIYNNLSLYIFGSRVEKYYGKKKFLLIYLLSGLAGSIGSVGMGYILSVNILSAGASGAIYGALGATFALGQKTKRQIDDLSAYTMGIMIVMGLAMGFLYPNIDNTAHIAGLVTGYLLGRNL